MAGLLPPMHNSLGGSFEMHTFHFGAACTLWDGSCCIFLSLVFLNCSYNIYLLLATNQESTMCGFDFLLEYDDRGQVFDILLGMLLVLLR